MSNIFWPVKVPHSIGILSPPRVSATSETTAINREVSRLRYWATMSGEGTLRLTITEVSTVEPKIMVRCGWPMTSSSNVGRSGMLLVTQDPADDFLRWLDSDFDGLRDELCFDLGLSSPSRWRWPSPRLLSDLWPESTARGPYESLRYVLSDIVVVAEEIDWSGGIVMRPGGEELGGSFQRETRKAGKVIRSVQWMSVSLLVSSHERRHTVHQGLQRVP